MKPFYLYFFLKSIKNDEEYKKIFEIALTLLKLLRFEILPLERDFPPLFRKLVAT